VTAIAYDYDSPRWFNLKLGVIGKRVPRATLAQAFARDIKDDGLVWGLSLLQVGRRHLLYVGAKNGQPHVCLGFFWLTRGRP